MSSTWCDILLNLSSAHARDRCMRALLRNVVIFAVGFRERELDVKSFPPQGRTMATIEREARRLRRDTTMAASAPVFCEFALLSKISAAEHATSVSLRGRCESKGHAFACGNCFFKSDHYACNHLSTSASYRQDR